MVRYKLELNSPATVKSTSSALIPHSFGRFRDKAREQKVRLHYPFILCTSRRMRENEKPYTARSYSDFRVADKRPRASHCCEPFISNYEISRLLMLYKLHWKRAYLISRNRVFVFIIRAGQGRRYGQMPEPTRKVATSKNGEYCRRSQLHTSCVPSNPLWAHRYGSTSAVKPCDCCIVSHETTATSDVGTRPLQQMCY